MYIWVFFDILKFWYKIVSLEKKIIIMYKICYYVNMELGNE